MTLGNGVLYFILLHLLNVLSLVRLQAKSVCQAVSHDSLIASRRKNTNYSRF